MTKVEDRDKALQITICPPCGLNAALLERGGIVQLLLRLLLVSFQCKAFPINAMLCALSSHQW